MKLTINSKEFGAITFSNYGGYIWVDLNGKSGTLGNQICQHGRLSGSTVTCIDATFEKCCRKWWRNHLRNRKKYCMAS